MIRKGQRATGVPYKRTGEIFTRLERLSFKDNNYDEDLVQGIIEKCPDLIPFAEVNSSLGRFAHLCREYQTKSGFIDNLLLGENGEICIVETKLWSNIEARRKVVAQIIDYASVMKGISFTEFETNVKKYRKSNEKLFDIYCNEIGTDWIEDEFTDAVSKNLRFGIFVLLIIGDGIKEEVESIAEYMECFPENKSTLGLVEIRLYKEGDDLLCMPFVVTRTTEISRTIIDIRNENICVSIDKTNNIKQNNVSFKTYSENSITDFLEEANSALEESTFELLSLYIKKCVQAGLETKVTQKGGINFGVTINTDNTPKMFNFFEYAFYDKSKRDVITLKVYKYNHHAQATFLLDETDINNYESKVATLLNNNWDKQKKNFDKIEYDISSPLLMDSFDQILNSFVELISETKQKYS